MIPAPTPVRLTPLLRGDLWRTIAYGVMRVAVGFGLCLTTGCTSSAYLTGTVDSGAGYDPGLGVRYELSGDSGLLRPRLDLHLAYMPKRHASSGYTYAGAAGLMLGKSWWVEPGWTVYGYESRFDDGTTWEKRQSSPYLRIGRTSPDWQVALRYVPPSDDSYNSDSLGIDWRYTGERWSWYVAPDVYRLTVNGERREDVGMRVGVGKVW